MAASVVGRSCRICCNHRRIYNDTNETVTFLRGPATRAPPAAQRYTDAVDLSRKVITARSELRNVLFFGAVCDFFVCA